MQVTNSRVQDGAYTTYTLEAVIEGQRVVARHIIPTDAYAALNVKDASDLIESQLWRFCRLFSKIVAGGKWKKKNLIVGT